VSTDHARVHLNRFHKRKWLPIVPDGLPASLETGAGQTENDKYNHVASVARLAPFTCGVFFIIAQRLDGEPAGLLTSLYVSPLFRRLGLGRELTQVLLNYGKTRGYRSAFLYVREDNDSALKLYEGLGFKIEDPPTLMTDTSGKLILSRGMHFVRMVLHLDPQD
jgi:GNAT superfamily N-acetyltransferase